MLQWAGLFHFLWCFVIQAVLELINCTAVTNRDLTPYQLFYDELEPVIAFHKLDLKAYRTIGSYCKVFILLEKRPKAYKVKARTKPRRLLAVLGFKTYLVYMFIRNTMIKTPFIKLYEFKNPLTLEGVSKLTEIRPLNDIAIIKDSTGEKVSLDLPEIDNIGSSESIILETPGLLEFLALRPSRLLEPENKPSESILRLPEELIKPMDSSDPDEMQLNLVISLYYRVKVKIFKKKLDKNSSTPNMYKQALKSPNVKEWLAVTFNEFKQLINLETLKFLSYEALSKGRKPLTNRLVFKEKKDQYDIIIKFKARLVIKGFIQIKGVDYFEIFASTTISLS